MNVRIKERPIFKVVGVKEEISLKDGANLWEIPKFWERVNLKDGLLDWGCNNRSDSLRI